MRIAHLFVLCLLCFGGFCQSDPLNDLMREDLSKYYLLKTSDSKAQNLMQELFLACSVVDRARMDSVWTKIEVEGVELRTRMDSAAFYFVSGYYDLRKDEYDAALLNILKAKRICTELEQTTAYNFVLLHEAMIDFYNDDFDTAILKWEKMVNDNADQHPIIAAKCWSNIGASVHTRTGIYGEEMSEAENLYATECYKKALLGFEKADFKYGACITNAVLIALAQANEDEELADKYLKKSWQLADELDWDTQRSFIRTKAAGILYNKGNYEAVLDTIEPAILYSEKSQNLPDLGGAITLKAYALLELKRYDEAFEAMKESKQILRKTHKKSTVEASKRHEIAFKTEKIAKELTAKELDLAEKEKENAEAALSLSRRNTIIYSLLAGLIFIISIAYLIAQNARRKAREKQIVAVSEERRIGLKAVIEAQETERDRIGKDLHDGICQILSAVKLQQLSFADEPTMVPDLKTKILANADMVAMAYREARELSHQLTPAALLNAGLESALRDLLRASFANTDTKHTFDSALNPETELPLDISQTFYRVLQELTTNILKHANAKNVQVELYQRKRQYILLVADDGIGMPSQNKDKGIGLHNIKSRLSVVNGHIDFDRAEPNGTVITVRIGV